MFKKGHYNLITYHDYGMLAYLNNNFDKSFDLLSKFIRDAEETGQLDIINDKVYHELGTVCIETMAYDKAIKFLTQALQQDPGNKAAYFDRALAYFETGQFDLAAEDYFSFRQRRNGCHISNSSFHGIYKCPFTKYC